MRLAPTDTEEMLWRELRGGRLGVAFRRQVPKLAVEVDGGYHAGRRAADERRDRYLARLGYRVVRVEAERVRAELRQAVARVRAVL